MIALARIGNGKNLNGLHDRFRTRNLMYAPCPQGRAPMRLMAGESRAYDALMASARPAGRLQCLAQANNPLAR